MTQVGGGRFEAGAEPPPVMSINPGRLRGTLGVKGSTTNGASSDLVKNHRVHHRRICTSLQQRIRRGRFDSGMFRSKDVQDSLPGTIA